MELSFHFYDFMLELRGPDFDFEDISGSPWLCDDFVEHHMETWNDAMRWNWKKLIENESISTLFLCRHQHCFIHHRDVWIYFLTTRQFDASLLPRVISKLSVRYLSRNPNLPMKAVMKYKTEDWDWNALCSNRTLRIHHVLQFPSTHSCTFQPFQRRILNWKEISRNPYCTTDDVVRVYPDFPWDYSSLSMNTSISMEYVVEHAHKPWDWKIISREKKVTKEILQHFQHLPWSYCEMSTNPSLTTEMVCAWMDKPWNWKYLYMNKNIHLDDDVLQQITLPSDFSKTVAFDRCLYHMQEEWKASWETPFTKFEEMLYRSYGSRTHPSYIDELKRKTTHIPLEFIERHLEIGWSFYQLSRHPELTFHFVRTYHDRSWDWHALGQHPFSCEKDMWVRQKKCFAFCQTIQHELMKAVFHPRRLQYYVSLGYTIDDWCENM